VQIYGGHGFIAEWGMEQNVRDSRISMLYEGTTGIQALDLLGRKVLMTQGEALKGFTKIVHKFCQAQEGNDAVKEFVEPSGCAEQGVGRTDHESGHGRDEGPRGSRRRVGGLPDVLRLRVPGLLLG
jgi:Acyl-CoA dehydrogenases